MLDTPVSADNICRLGIKKTGRKYRLPNSNGTKYRPLCTVCFEQRGTIRLCPVSSGKNNGRRSAAQRAMRAGLCSQHRSEAEANVVRG